jgi:hypothetical protein
MMTTAEDFTAAVEGNVVSVRVFTPEYVTFDPSQDTLTFYFHDRSAAVVASLHGELRAKPADYRPDPTLSAVPPTAEEHLSERTGALERAHAQLSERVGTVEEYVAQGARDSFPVGEMEGGIDR